MRLALGSSRMRLVRQLLTESVVLGVVSGSVAAGAAAVGIRAFASVLPREFHRSSVYDFAVGGRVVLFAVALSVVAGLMLGALPALRGSSAGTLGRVAGGARSGVPRGGARLRDLLVAGEVALTMPLLVGAALFVSSFQRLVRVDAGFDADRVAVLTLRPPEARYPTARERAELFGRLESALQDLPRVEG